MYILLNLLDAIFNCIISHFIFKISSKIVLPAEVRLVQSLVFAASAPSKDISIKALLIHIYRETNKKHLMKQFLAGCRSNIGGIGGTGGRQCCRCCIKSNNSWLKPESSQHVLHLLATSPLYMHTCVGAADCTVCLCKSVYR